MCEDYTGERFQPVLTTKGSEMIVQYDEHRLTNNFKFGIIYQTFKQVRPKKIIRFSGHFWQKTMRQAGFFFFFFFLLMKQARELFFLLHKPFKRTRFMKCIL